MIDANVDFACGHIAEHYPGVELARPEGTCMLFLDCPGWLEEHGRDLDWLLRAGWRVGVGCQHGRPSMASTPFALT